MIILFIELWPQSLLKFHNSGFHNMNLFGNMFISDIIKPNWNHTGAEWAFSLTEWVSF